MSLRDLATAGLDGFDAKKDSVQGNSGIPFGKYTAVIENTIHKVSKNRFEYFQVTYSVLEGEQIGRKEFQMITLDETKKDGTPVSDFVLTTNIKFVAKLGALMGVEITDDDFADENVTDLYEHLAQKFRGHEGTVVILDIHPGKNKKDPSNPYRNYDLQETEQPGELDVTDDELPSNINSDEQANLNSLDSQASNVAAKMDALDPDPFANNATTAATDDTNLPFD